VVAFVGHNFFQRLGLFGRRLRGFDLLGSRNRRLDDRRGIPVVGAQRL
jgi:hypothetical protein